MKIPREHGLYVVVASCWLTGLVVARNRNWGAAILLLVVTTLALFLVAPARDLLRSRIGGRIPRLQTHDRVVIPLLAVSVIAGGGVIIASTPPVAIIAALGLVLAIVYGIGVHRRVSMIALSITGFLAATLITPATLLTSNPDATVLALLSTWAMVASWFCASIFVVRLRITSAVGAGPGVLYHIGATVALVALTALGVPPVPLLLPMGLAWVRLGIIHAELQRWQELPLKRIGIIETLAAVVVVAGIAATS